MISLILTYYKYKLSHFNKAKFNFGYEKLKSTPIIFENFGYIDPRSLLLINKLVSLAAKNTHKQRSDVNYVFKTKISNIITKAHAKAGLAPHYYSFDNSYCRFENFQLYFSQFCSIVFL